MKRTRLTVHSSGWIADDLGLFYRLVLVTNGGSFEAGIYPVKDRPDWWIWDAVLRTQGRAPEVTRTKNENALPVQEARRYVEKEGRSKLRARLLA